MLFLTAFGAALALAQGALGKEKAQNMKEAAELYDTGIMMDRIMMKKQVSLKIPWPIVIWDRLFFLAARKWRLTKAKGRLGGPRCPGSL